MTCEDCGLEIEKPEGGCQRDSYVWQQHVGRYHWVKATHPGRCCDCFDEHFGMPAAHRSRPRPE